MFGGMFGDVENIMSYCKSNLGNFLHLEFKEGKIKRIILEGN
jgi:hypothetical protein